MADNKLLPPTGAGTSNITVATRSVTYSGDTADVQVVGLGVFSGSDDAKTVLDVTTTDPLPVVDIGMDTGAAGQVEISSSSTTVVSSRAGRKSVLIVNYQTVPIYIDPSGGTAATTHFRLDPGAGLTLPIAGTITARTSAAYTASSGDTKVHYIESY